MPPIVSPEPRTGTPADVLRYISRAMAQLDANPATRARVLGLAR